MSTTATLEAPAQTTQNAQLVRILAEGHGPGAWHGPDLAAALADVDGRLAFWRPAPERHNIAEIALHHAFCVRNVSAQVSGEPATPFLVAGEDWFALDSDGPLAWPAVLAEVASQQERLIAAVTAVGAAGDASAAFDVILGITCHAVYHAGQVQLIKRLHAGS
jgi:hypothetical protein